MPRNALRQKRHKGYSIRRNKLRLLPFFILFLFYFFPPNIIFFPVRLGWPPVLPADGPPLAFAFLSLSLPLPLDVWHISRQSGFPRALPLLSPHGGGAGRGGSQAGRCLSPARGPCRPADCPPAGGAPAAAGGPAFSATWPTRTRTSNGVDRRKKVVKIAAIKQRDIVFKIAKRWRGLFR